VGNKLSLQIKEPVSILLHFLFVLCLLPAVIFSYRHADYNWDMLGYMAVVIKMDGVKDFNKIHDATYKIAKENVPTKEYNRLVDTSGPRARFATDPLFFKRVLPIHVVKPLYLWCVYLFYKAGFNLPLATAMPSVISYIFIGLLLFIWVKNYLDTAVAFLSALLVMYSSFMLAAARISSPDTISAFFLLATFYFILERPNIWLMFLFSLLAILSRVDNLITCFFMISFLAFSGKWDKRISKGYYFLMLLILGGEYLAIILPIRQFGWSLTYYWEYARHMNFNRDFDKPLSLSDYSSYMVSKIVTALVSSHFVFFTFLATLIVSQPLPKKSYTLTFDQLLILLLMMVVLVRFILLPDLSDRFYISLYLLILIVLIRKIKKVPGYSPPEKI
jgi:hypothetical protein